MTGRRGSGAQCWSTTATRPRPPVLDSNHSLLCLGDNPPRLSRPRHCRLRLRLLLLLLRHIGKTARLASLTSPEARP
ncbi:hypothetical protein ACP4OV_007043 [Aristida adscensionis]